LESKLLLAHEELMKSQTTLSIVESEKAEDLRELAGMKVQLEEKFQFEDTAITLDAAAIEAHNSLPLWRKPHIGRPTLMQC
jgi:hypothetical protein